MVRAFVWGQEMDHSGKYIADDLQKIGINLLLAGELDAAIDHFRQATYIYHVVPWALEWEAAAHWLKGAPAGAVQCWLRALECPYQSLGHLPKYLYFSAVRWPHAIEKSVAVHWCEKHLASPRIHSVSKLQLNYLLGRIDDTSELDLPTRDPSQDLVRGAQLVHVFLNAIKAWESGNKDGYYSLLDNCVRNEYSTKRPKAIWHIWRHELQLR